MVLTSTLKVALEHGPYIGAVPFLPHRDSRVFMVRPRSWVRKVLVIFLECPGGGFNTWHWEVTARVTRTFFRFSGFSSDSFDFFYFLFFFWELDQQRSWRYLACAELAGVDL